jgi:SAM-dependent methyltransferase
VGDWLLVRNPDGYFEIEPKPSAEELAAHYRNKYYGRADGVGQYAHGYTAEELEHKCLSPAEAERVWNGAPGTLFEVGVGEGFTLDYFAGRGWDVRGVDFTDDGLRGNFPELMDRLKTGDAFALLDQAIEAGERYDLVICNNVVEHVIDPPGLLQRLRRIVKPGGLLRLAAPNDGSWLQHEVVARGLAGPEFWLAPPEHLSYFTAESLGRVIENNGWTVAEMLAEFPVDLYALNPDSAYTRDPSKGRNCHFARVAFEMGLWRRGLDAVIDFRRACARAGIGRNLTAYARPA